MTGHRVSVHPIEASDLIIGAPLKRRHRKPTLMAALKAARKAGADRVEIIDGKIVIALAGGPAKPNGNPPGSCLPGANPWDYVLPGGDDGAD